MQFKRLIYPFIFLVFGIFIFFFPILLNSDLMFGDLGDSRFINYVLEHGFQFIKHSPIHSSFWDLPIFYPNKNTLSYSDILLGGMIIYTPIRFFFNPQTTYQIWLIVVCFLNFISTYLLLKNIFKFKPVISSLGAFIFVFSLPRYSQIYHTQLYLQFFTVFSLYCFLSVKKEYSKIKNYTLFILGSLFFSLQIYSCFYLGWFFAFGSSLLLIILLCFKNARKNIFEFIKYFKYEILTSFIFLIISLLPLYFHYHAVGVEFEFYLTNLKLKNFFLSESLIDNLFFKTGFSNNCEENIGLGFFTTILLIIGLFKLKGQRKYFLIFISVIILLFAFLPLKALLYAFIPAASAIRASSRVIFLLIFADIYVISAFLDNIKNKFLLTSIILLVTLEQIPILHHFEWSKKEHNKRINSYTYEKQCKIVTYDIKAKPDFEYLLDIMWFASENNLYTKNGYSGHMPEISNEKFENECKYTIIDK